MTSPSSALDVEAVPATGWNNRYIESCVGHDMAIFHMDEAITMKKELDQLAAELTQRHDKVQLLNEIISEINLLTDEQTNGLDIGQNADLLEKLNVARELGVRVKEGQTRFTRAERDRLIENLHLQAEIWERDNRKQSQQTEILVKTFDRILLLCTDTIKKVSRIKEKMAGAGGK